MVPLLQWILAHAATAMALAVGYGELLIGISLLIGRFSRAASLFGCVRLCWRCGSRGLSRTARSILDVLGSLSQLVGFRDLFCRTRDLPIRRGDFGVPHNFSGTPLRNALCATFSSHRTLSQQWIVGCRERRGTPGQFPNIGVKL